MRTRCGQLTIYRECYQSATRTQTGCGFSLGYGAMVGGEGGAKIFNDFLHGSYMKKPGKSRASQKWPKPLFYMVPGDRIELPTRGFSIHIKGVLGGVNLRLFFLVNQYLSFKNSILP